MPTKQGTSPKLKRANKTPKSGPVHKHAPKRADRLYDSGLLEDLHRSSLQNGRVTSQEENLEAATNLLFNELGERVTTIVKRDNWQPVVRPLVLDYIKSVVYGDGNKPEILSSECTKVVNSIFVELCSKRILGDDVLPGQRQDWYQPALTAYRKRKSQPRQKRHFSPLNMAPKQADAEQEIQPTD